jgi:hypothetical protein
MIVSPAKPKASIAESPRGLEVVVPARRSWFVPSFLGLWLCGWAAGEIAVSTQLLTSARDVGGARLFMLVWLAAWTLGGGFALYVFLWSLVGRERIVLTPSILSIQRELFGLGRLREYELIHVRDLRVSRDVYNPFDVRSGLQFWGIGGGAIAFDHGAGTVRFGAAIDEGEAKAIVERMRTHAAVG